MKKILLFIILFSSLLLLAINLYGLTQTLRPAEFKTEELRFGDDDISLSLDEYKEQVKRLPNETDVEYAKRLTKVISQGTAHIHWGRYESDKFNELVPVWENWILYLMGMFSGIPEFERYHFVTPSKSIERGIGICGEVSMLMEQLLEENGIPAQIISFPGHVIVAAQPNKNELLLDPDFGVVLPVRLNTLSSNIDQVNDVYLATGYTESDAEFFAKAYSGSFTKWAGPHHFIQKKYYFEHVSYVAKWLIPVVGFGLGVIGLYRIRESVDSDEN